MSIPTSLNGQKAVLTQHSPSHYPPAMLCYSIIIPAYNEAPTLPLTLLTLKEVMSQIPEVGEVIVCDNHSSDDTSQVAKQLGARVIYEAENQIGRARNTGASIAQGQYLIFLDADTQINAPLLRAALDQLQAGRCCGGGTQVAMDRKVGLLPTALLTFWNTTSRLLGLAAGCFFFCRRDAFDAVGGFNKRFYAGEEIQLSWDLKCWGKKQGYRFQILSDQHVITSSRKLDHLGKVLIATLTCILLPFSITSKKMCGYWYKRE